MIVTGIRALLAHEPQESSCGLKNHREMEARGTGVVLDVPSARVSTPGCWGWRAACTGTEQVSLKSP